MGNSSGTPQRAPGREAKVLPSATQKLPMPPEEELEIRFNTLLSTVNLPADKAGILSQYDKEKKWDLVCDQERFQVKNPPSAYLEKLKSFVDHGGASRKFKRQVQESTAVLRELEISLRTNHIGWAQEFLSEENQGLKVLVEYLSLAQSAVMCDLSAGDNSNDGGLTTDKGKAQEKSAQDDRRIASSSPSQEGSKPCKAR